MRVIVLAIMFLFASSAKADTFTHVEANATWQAPWIHNNQPEWFTASFDWNVDTNTFVEGSVFAATSIGTIVSWFINPSRANFFTDLTYPANGYIIQLCEEIYHAFHRDSSLFAAPGEYTQFATDGIYLRGPDIPLWAQQTPNSHLSVTAIQTPEPGTCAMLLLGLLLLYVLACYNQKVGNVVHLVRGKW